MPGVPAAGAREARERRLPVAAAALSAALGMYAGCADGTGPRDGAGDVPAATVMAPSPVVFDEARLRAADSLVHREVERESFPGGALVVGVGPQVVHRSAYGRVEWTAGAEFVDTRGTMYDLASLTKSVAAASAVWLLVEDGRMGLDDPVSRHLPEFAGGREYGVTIRQLLTHTAGVRAGAFPRNDDPRVVRRQLVALRPLLVPGADVLYSDIGYVVLWEAAQRAAGEPLPAFLRRRIWEPLGMGSTRLGVPRGCPECAPTLFLRQTREPYRGGSYDQVARRLGGITGNAGLFATADDLARFAAMIANGGELDGVRIFREETVRAMLAPHEGSGTFTLGWVTYCGEPVESNQVPCDEVMAVGHTGSTGTALWIDPESRTWMVLLTNRVYLPRRRDFVMQDFRRRVFSVLVGEGG
jgi:serine-type D-Ala-D-Ala carboxypeptidase